ncbi:ABC transporter permease protein [Alloalcanivorax dieselolei B5]|uniref:ABC transporter permease protein n=1 Tax=Alcanivorax dieselolei (strain DSM 16502 / CGMCC 1.3690 / MCCC 1A00001 / B-5) TaxID=930169 RepID=K0CA01_ALCDB|nr:branched-chain amino acid ABC transporter permease [Alloalcanivorax dieselolei]AFT69438.1 ABC transporter permease protein [Alloalcanivorax dieselolei B5]GGJ92707.1 branched-chain amino acid ABC transporter permease [Alloalcanivorax dieselolei]
MMFFLEVLIGGLLAGVMYALVALGFVLIFKASGIFNFAQAAMVLFAAMFMGGMHNDWGLPYWLAIPITLVIMIGVAWVIERVVLRPMVNQEPIILFMSTIGIFFALIGFAEIFWGSRSRTLDVGIPSDPIFLGDLLLQSYDLITAAIVAALVVGLVLFSQKTRMGRVLRAVADDHQAAQSVGIKLSTVWVVVWSIAGLVAVVAGIVWGGALGVQPVMVDVAFKALPVLLLGGLTSIPGAIVAGLIIGAGEALAEVYLGPIIGGGIDSWFAYIIAMAFMVWRPEGLFGEKIIERI